MAGERQGNGMGTAWFASAKSRIPVLLSIVHKINDLENKSFCTAAFIDISQAFDKYGTKDFLQI
jgi:hypothetical protein